MFRGLQWRRRSGLGVFSHGATCGGIRRLGNLGGVPGLIDTPLEFAPWLAIASSSVLALGAFLKRALSVSGALAAWMVGSLVWLGLGLGGFGVLCVFFLTSTLLGRVGRAVKAPLQVHYSKGDQRDAWQVFANGGVAAFSGAAVLLQSAFAAQVLSPSVWALLGTASLASANADTWATELGVLSRSRPVHLLQLRRVEAGTSGAVSLLGLGVAAAGASCIALATVSFLGDAVSTLGSTARVTLIITIAGWLGALVDSVLGATLQRQQRCAQCSRVVEASVHCGRPTQSHGPFYALLDNDHVNLLANTSAAALALVWLGLS